MGSAYVGWFIHEYMRHTKTDKIQTVVSTSKKITEEPHKYVTLCYNNTDDDRLKTICHSWKHRCLVSGNSFMTVKQVRRATCNL